MDVTDDGMSMDVSPVQPPKAHIQIDVTDDGMLTSVSPVQRKKA
jgi:hypothetical protein